MSNTEDGPRRDSGEYQAYLNSLTIPELLERLEAETGLTPATSIKRLLENHQRILDMIVNTEGEFRVLGVDVYDNEDWIAGKFDSREAAVAFVRKKTEEANAHPNYSRIDFGLDGTSKNRVQESTARYYSYTPNGDYIE